MTRTKLAILGLCVLTGAAIGQAATARADSQSYLEGVAAHGVPITSVTLELGGYICKSMRDNGTAGLDQQATLARNAGVSNYDAAVLIVEAANELCPSQLGVLNEWLHSGSPAST